jgi:hypothetical protein
VGLEQLTCGVPPRRGAPAAAPPPRSGAPAAAIAPLASVESHRHRIQSLGSGEEGRRRWRRTHTWWCTAHTTISMACTGESGQRRPSDPPAPANRGSSDLPAARESRIGAKPTTRWRMRPESGSATLEQEDVVAARGWSARERKKRGVRGVALLNRTRVTAGRIKPGEGGPHSAVSARSNHRGTWRSRPQLQLLQLVGGACSSAAFVRGGGIEGRRRENRTWMSVF